MKIPLLLLFFIMVWQNTIAQNLIGLKERTLVYEAFFIETNGDTLTVETIDVQFTNQPWTIKSQDEVKFTYFTDTVAIQHFRHPFKNIRKKQQKKALNKSGWKEWTWLDTVDITGYILNDSTLWMHPPRDNQYLYNELSGMPSIKLDQLFIGGNWKSKLIIMLGWHDFKGTLETLYQVKENVNYNKGSISVSNAWKIELTHTHSKLGTYKSTIIFDENQFGFLQFQNTFYDGRMIVLNLIATK